MNQYVTGAVIKELREKNKMTQLEFADKLGVSDKTVSKWETGKGYPDITLLEPIADVFSISVTELISGITVVNSNVSANMMRSKFYVCPVCGNRAELERSDIFWCDECRIPLYQKHCSMGHKVRRLTTDIRPVFPEERLLLEILLGEPFCFREDSVWNATGNKYIVNGKRIEFSIHKLKAVDADRIRQRHTGADGSGKRAETGARPDAREHPIRSGDHVRRSRADRHAARTLDEPAGPHRRDELPDGRAAPRRRPHRRRRRARRHRDLPMGGGAAGRCRRAQHHGGDAAAHDPRHPAPAGLRSPHAGAGTPDVRAPAPAAAHVLRAPSRQRMGGARTTRRHGRVGPLRATVWHRPSTRPLIGRNYVRGTAHYRNRGHGGHRGVVRMALAHDGRARKRGLARHPCQSQQPHD